MQLLKSWILIIALAWGAPVAAAPARPSPAAPTAPAVNVTVGNGDHNTCTAGALQAALDQVQLSGSGQISFNCGAAPHTIIVTATLNVNTPVTIDGGNLGAITVSGGDDRPVMHVLPSGTLTLTELVVAHGQNYASHGACIEVTSGVLVLNHVIVHSCNNGLPLATAEAGEAGPIVQGSNSDGGAIANVNGAATILNSQILSSSADSGGGIYNTGRLTVIDSRVAGNHALYNGGGLLLGGLVDLDGVLIEHNSGGLGGGLGTFQSAQLSVLHTRLYSNTSTSNGGGLWSSGALTLTESSLEQNLSADNGGGLFVFTGTATLDQVQVLGNHAQSNGGGVFLFGGLFSMTQSLVDGNTASDAGGVMNNSARATLSRVTLSHNHADGDAGGFYETSGGGWSVLTNVTVSGNEADSWGGGLKSSTTLTLTNVTVANNQAGGNGGGLYRVSSGYQYAFRNVLLANNHAAGTGDNCYGPAPNFELASLSSDATCGVSSQNANLPLGPLQVNGGMSGLLLPTHLSLPGSFAIDGGTNSGCPAVDERGVTRPINSVCDAGAVENNAVLPWLWLPLVRK